MAFTPYPAGTRMHIKQNGVKALFLEAGNINTPFPLRAVKEPVKAMRPWQEGEYIGLTTGRTQVIEGKTWQEVNMELVLWRTRLFDSVREDRLGWFILEEGNVVSSAELLDARVNNPTTTGTTGGNESDLQKQIELPKLQLAGNQPKPGDGSPKDNTTTYIIVGAVLVVVAALVYFLRPQKSRRS